MAGGEDELVELFDKPYLSGSLLGNTTIGCCFEVGW